jgi:glycosyltransferase involved in cell wall biosynthesis
LHVVFLSYWYEANASTPEDLLEAYPTLTGWVDALHREGATVTVLQRFHWRGEFQRNGVNFIFHPDRYGPQLRGWQIPWSFHRAISKVRSSSDAEPLVIHLDGLIFPLQLRALRTLLPAEFPIAVQHHAEKPWQGPRRHLQRWGLRAADGFFFAASDLALSWIDQGMILGRQPVYQIMEGSTQFRREDRETARARTSMTGDPVMLWVGRLIALKDPLTVLKGFHLVLEQMPGARLYMVYGSDDLLPEVRACIADSPLLSASVTLCGSLPHAALETIYNSADYFVLGSHYEGSGYSLAEALACGVVPVVTDIASFRAMTDNGSIGACWPPGDAGAFAAAFLRVAERPVQALSDEAVHFFENHLSFPAIARKALRAYHELVAKRTEKHP